MSLTELFMIPLANGRLAWEVDMRGMDIFYALAEPRRRSILEILATRGRLSASDISAQFRVSPQAVSQHLKVLRQAKLVQMEKQAQQRMYKINPATIQELESWAKQLADRWDERFNVLDTVLETEKQKETAQKRPKEKKHGKK